MRFGLAALVFGSIVCAGSVLAAAGCQSSGTLKNVAPTIQSLEGTWTAQTIDGGSVAAMLEEGMRAPDLKFLDDGSVVGFAGVNRLNTRIDLEKLRAGEVSMGPYAMTMMAGPPAAMRLERRFVEALEKSTSIAVDGDTMTLSNAEEAVLTLTRNP